MIESVAELTDRELWARARLGQSAAFGELFDRHNKSVYNYCFRATASWSMAEDLLSETFLHAWRRHLELEPEGDSALPLLLGVATGCLNNALRANRRRLRWLNSAPEPRPEPDHSDDVVARVADETRMARVLSRISQLPERDRTMLQLHVMGQLSYVEVAEAMDIPVGTVRSALSRMRSKLRSSEVVHGHGVEGSIVPLPAPEDRTPAESPAQPERGEL